MRIPDDHPLNRTLALRHPETAYETVFALGRTPDISAEASTGFAELIAADSHAKACAAAVDRLRIVDGEIAAQAMTLALQSRFAQVRLTAIRYWQEAEAPDPMIETLLRTDPAWGNRRAAMHVMAESADRWQVLFAADDPHWRVRHALIRVLLEWASDRDEIRARLQANPARRARALLAFLEYRWTDVEPGDVSAFALPDPVLSCPFWDWDPAVLAAKLGRMTTAERRANIDAMSHLIGHDDERVWKLAVKAIRDFGEPSHFRAAFEWRSDPRHGAEPALERLLDGLDEELREELAALSGPPLPPSPEVTVSGGEGSPLAGLPASRMGSVVRAKLPTSIRAASLTPEAAARIVADPTSETSWDVLAAACRVAKVPLWEIEPAKKWTPPVFAPPAPSPISSPLGTEAHLVPLGPDGLRVSRLGVSGHYLLPAAAFALAADAGVNWFFWEPNYTTLTDFSRRLSDEHRRQFHFVAGTFEAEGKRIRTDVERALRLLKVEQLGLFLVFWVQSWDRMTDELRDTVAKLKAEGKVRSVGLSSHNRPLLVRAMQGGWNPVMARHSAGHRGAETGVFPFVPDGTSLITFNNLCYGRLLQPVAELTPPSAADCYRYTLSFPQVTACWSAPATWEQLEENLTVLRDPTLTAEKREQLETFGAALYRDEKVFEKLVRMT